MKLRSCKFGNNTQRAQRIFLAVIGTALAILCIQNRVQAATNIISGTISNVNANYYVGSNAACNALIIQNSGALSNLNAYVGYLNGGDSNTVTVTGSGSAWTNAGVLQIGSGGSAVDSGDYNMMVVSNGARVYNSGAGAVGGGYMSESNKVYVDGAGSLWTNGGLLAIGGGDLWTFNNGLIVRNGGKVVSITARSGLAGKSTAETCRNYAIIDGTGSLWQAGSDFCPACGGSELTVTNGGQLLCSAVYLSCGGIGAKVVVTGPGSCWSNSPGGNWDGLGVNFSKNATLIATNGGKFYTGGALRMGWLSSATGNVYKATGTNSLIEVGGSSGVTIGNNNTIIAENGGQWKANVMLGGGPSSVAGSSNCNNRIEVRGAGSIIGVPTLYVGDRVSLFTYCSNNTCVVTNGGSLTNTICYVGPQANAYFNRLQVSGSNSYFNSATELNIGEKGSYNDFRVDSGALAQAGICNIGSSNNYPTNNTLMVAGAGTVFSNTTLNVGNSGGGSGNRALIGDGGHMTIGDTAHVYSNACVTNYVQGKSAGLDLLKNNDNALVVDNGGKIHIAFSGQVGADGDNWGLRWVGDRTNALTILQAAGKLTWDTNGLSAAQQVGVGIYRDAACSYVGCMPANAFNYVHQSMTGDCTVVARVATFSATNAGACAGVMMRQGTNANAVEASAMLMPKDNRVYFHWRPSSGGAMSSVYSAAGAAPYWVKLVRASNMVRAYMSANGASWTQVGADTTVIMTNSIQVGLAVSSGTTLNVRTGTFDSVAITSP